MQWAIVNVGCIGDCKAQTQARMHEENVAPKTRIVTCGSPFCHDHICLIPSGINPAFNSETSSRSQIGAVPHIYILASAIKVKCLPHFAGAKCSPTDQYTAVCPGRI